MHIPEIVSHGELFLKQLTVVLTETNKTRWDGVRWTWRPHCSLRKGIPDTLQAAQGPGTVGSQWHMAMESSTQFPQPLG